ncbi:50S ribosomal protein L18 [bacterium]|nr:50S ribosomal protein L18 [bacterium]
MRDRAKNRIDARSKRRIHTRKIVNGTAERPRLTVRRSHAAIYAQMIDDVAGSTLVAADSRKLGDVEVPEELNGKCATAYKVGRQIAESAKSKGIETVVFDRSGYLYHGRVAALARGAREGGLKF